MKCVSCNYEHEENYCSQCGEKKDVSRITFVSLIEDVMSSVTNMDRGFLFNLKTLFLNPKKIISAYIKGKRKGVLNPVSYLIFSITIYLIVLTVFPDISDRVDEPENKVNKLGFKIGKFIRTYIKYFWVLSVVPLGASLRLLYRKYNYFEHLAIGSFVIAQATLVGVVSYLILGLPLILDPIVYLTMFWLIYKIFIGKDFTESFLLVFLTLIIFFIELILVIVGIAFLVA